MSDDLYSKIFDDSHEHLIPLKISLLGMALINNIANEIDIENIFKNDIDFKKKITRQINISESAYKKAMAELYKKNIIYRFRRGKYMLSPYIAARVNQKDIIILREQWDVLIEMQKKSKFKKIK